MGLVKLHKGVHQKMITNLCCKTFMLICFINHGKSVPIDYCLHPLDKSDCGLKPTPVFSYYKSGSRCEIEYWRGCPTFNKFDNEFICSHYCIGKLWDRASEKEVKIMSDVIELGGNDECTVPMNEEDCGIVGQYKYTFTGDLCIRVAWMGCESHNLFDDELTCVSTCNPQNTIYDFETQLQELPLDAVEAIKNILDNVIPENITLNTTEFVHKHQKLMMKITEKTTTRAVAEPDTTATPETVSETVETTSEGIETTSEVLEITSEDIEPTSEVIEATSKVIETTSQVIETTSEVIETTREALKIPSEAIETTVEVTTPDTTVTTEGPSHTTTEGTGSVEEVQVT